MKITAEFDSQTQEMVVKRDGVTVPDVEGIVFYPSYDDPSKGHVELTTVSRTDDEVTTVVRIMADEIESEDRLSDTNSILTAYRLFDEGADVELDYSAEDLEFEE